MQRREFEYREKMGDIAEESAREMVRNRLFYNIKCARAVCRVPRDTNTYYVLT